MSHIEVVKLTGTTNSSGAATILSEDTYNAKLCMVQWVDGDLADGVDAVLSVTKTGTGVDYTLLTLTDANNDAVYHTRGGASSATGAAMLYAADGTAVPVKVPVVGQLKLVIADGGSAKTGGAYVFLEC
jgi:hypothetical protein